MSGGNRSTDIALPSEASLQRAFGGSRTTVRKALAELQIPKISKPLEAVEAPQNIAKHLGVEPGAAVFRIQRIGSAQDGSVIELSTNFVRGDRYYFSYSGANEEFER